jgi:hypothetical protein
MSRIAQNALSFDAMVEPRLMPSSFVDFNMPEPGTLLLVGTGLLATHFVSRKRSFIFNFVHRRFAHVHGVLVGLLPRNK